MAYRVCVGCGITEYTAMDFARWVCNPCIKEERKHEEIE
jgi:hypothetical protein|tara:strand:+ start:2799 stop:2915 length:117 start_codon:yes stop_codon:yes gene_type:complete